MAAYYAATSKNRKNRDRDSARFSRFRWRTRFWYFEVLTDKYKKNIFECPHIVPVYHQNFVGNTCVLQCVMLYYKWLHCVQPRFLDFGNLRASRPSRCTPVDVKTRRKEILSNGFQHDASLDLGGASDQVWVFVACFAWCRGP